MDERGQALAGVELQAGPAQGLGSRRRLDRDGWILAVARASATRSDSSGHFVLEGLPVQPLRAVAWGREHALASREVGAELGQIDFTLIPAPPLSGVVRRDGVPAPSAHVTWQDEEGQAWPAHWDGVRADREGRFELPRPERGTLAPAALLEDARAQVSLELDDGPSSWDAELAPARPWSARLLEHDGRPGAGLYLNLRCARTGRLLEAASAMPAAGRCSRTRTRTRAIWWSCPPAPNGAGRARSYTA